MRGGRFLSCRHGAMGVVHLVVVHGPGHGVDFSGIVLALTDQRRKPGSTRIPLSRNLDVGH